MEILLGFGTGLLAALFVQEPLVWFLHYLGLTSRHAFSMVQTLPLGVPAFASRAFWGGAFGVALAWFGSRYQLGARWAIASVVFTASVRTIVDWFIAPMFWGRFWVGWSADALFTPVIINFVWAAAAVVLLAFATLVLGTWGMRSAA